LGTDGSASLSLLDPSYLLGFLAANGGNAARNGYDAIEATIDGRYTEAL